LAAAERKTLPSIRKLFWVWLKLATAEGITDDPRSMARPDGSHRCASEPIREVGKMNIHGIASTVGPQSVEQVGAVNSASAPAEPSALNDVVEISTAAKLAAKIHEIPDIRADLVAQVKAQIEAGTYETPERIDATINRLMEDLL